MLTGHAADLNLGIKRTCYVSSAKKRKGLMCKSSQRHCHTSKTSLQYSLLTSWVFLCTKKLIMERILVIAVNIWQIILHLSSSVSVALAVYFIYDVSSA
jgi:hypothetical protein